MDRTTRERVAMLCDELLRRGVPRDAVQLIISWLDAQDPMHVRQVHVPGEVEHVWPVVIPWDDNASDMTSNARRCCYTHAPKIVPCMIVCPVCGDKRCARALDCGLECAKR